MKNWTTRGTCTTTTTAASWESWLKPNVGSPRPWQGPGLLPRALRYSGLPATLPVLARLGDFLVCDVRLPVIAEEPVAYFAAITTPT